jgi:hypothetical protein
MGGRSENSASSGIFWLMVWWLLGSAPVGDSLNSQYKIFPSSSPLLSFGLGAIVILILGAGIFFIAATAYSRFSTWRKNRTLCTHGVANGESQNRCKECLREKREIEENNRRSREAAEKQQRIKTEAEQLRSAEQARLAKSIVPSLDELRNLSWQQFEDEIARMFERFGYKVEQTPYVKDQGRDAILWKNGQKSLLECKKYSESGRSGRPDLQKFYAAVSDDSATYGHFITTGTFTNDAKEYAATHPIELIDGGELVKLMFKSRPSPSTEDKYSSMCEVCGEIVFHRLRIPQPVTCVNSHPVLPTLNIEQVLSSSGATPICPDCRVPMRLIRGRRGKFWGCSRFPRCHRTQNWRTSP